MAPHTGIAGSQTEPRHSWVDRHFTDNRGRRKACSSACSRMVNSQCVYSRFASAAAAAGNDGESKELRSRLSADAFSLMERNLMRTGKLSLSLCGDFLWQISATVFHGPECAPWHTSCSPLYPSVRLYLPVL